MNKIKVNARSPQDRFLFHLTMYLPVKIPNGRSEKKENRSMNIGISFR